MSRPAARRDFSLYATATVCLWIFSAQGDTILTAAETLDIASVPADLQVPPLSPGPPAAGAQAPACVLQQPDWAVATQTPHRRTDPIGLPLLTFSSHVSSVPLSVDSRQQTSLEASSELPLPLHVSVVGAPLPRPLPPLQPATDRNRGPLARLRWLGASCPANE